LGVLFDLAPIGEKTNFSFWMTESYFEDLSELLSSIDSSLSTFFGVARGSLLFASMSGGYAFCIGYAISTSEGFSDKLSSFFGTINGLFSSILLTYISFYGVSSIAC
jgi:hypothetical protein